MLVEHLGANPTFVARSGSVSNRDIIVIGGSSGATAPLKKILSALPADLPAAVFVVLHIPAQGIGICRRLSVRQAGFRWFKPKAAW